MLKNFNPILILIAIGIIFIVYKSTNTGTLSLYPPQPPPHATLTKPNVTTYLYSIALSGLTAQNQSYINRPINITVNLTISQSNVSTTWSPGNTLVINTQCASYIYSNTTRKFVYQSPIVNQTTTSYIYKFTYTSNSSQIDVIGGSCLESYTIWNPSTQSWSVWVPPFIAVQSNKAVQFTNLPLSPPSSGTITINNFYGSIISYIQALTASFINYLRSINLIK